MSSFLNTVNKLAKDIGDKLDTNKDSNNESPSKGGGKLSLEKAPREDLIEYIKKQAVHTKKVESRLTELLEAYKKVSKEKTDLKTEYDDLNEKYVALCGTKETEDSVEGTTNPSPNDTPEPTITATTPTQVRQDTPHPSPHQLSLEKIVARLEREREGLLRQVVQANEAVRAQTQGADIQFEEYKAQVKQLNEQCADYKSQVEQLNAKIDGELKAQIAQLTEKVSEWEAKNNESQKECEELQAHADHANSLVKTLQKECDDAKDTFNIAQKRIEEEKALAERQAEASLETMQNAFQAERDILKGEIQKVIVEMNLLKEKHKQDREKFEEDLLNMELERRTAEEKLQEAKGSGDVVVQQEWEDQKKKLEEELEEERQRAKKLVEELSWERTRKDTFDKRLEGIENKVETERNRTFELETRHLDNKITELEGLVTRNNEELEAAKLLLAQREEELNNTKQQLNDKLVEIEGLVKEKEQAQLEASGFKSKLEEGGASSSETSGALHNEELVNLRQQLEDSTKELAEKSQVESRADELERTRVKLEEELRNAKQQLEAIAKEVADLAKAKEDAEESLKAQKAKWSLEQEQWEQRLVEVANKLQEEKEQDLLSEQAKWQKYQQGSEETGQLLSDAIKSREEMYQKIVTAENLLKQLEAEKLELSSKLQQAIQDSQDNEKVHEFLENLGSEKNLLATEVDRLRQLLEDAKDTEKVTSAKLAAVSHQLETTLQEAVDERKTLTESVNLYESELAQHKEAHNKFLPEIDALKKQLQEAVSKVEAAEAEKASLVSRVSELEATTSELGLKSSRGEDLELKIVELQVTNLKLAEEVESLTKVAEANKEEHALILAAKLSEIVALEDKLRKIEVKEQRKSKDVTDKTETDGEELETLRTELGEKVTELFQLRQELNNRDNVIIETKALLDQNILQQSQLREDIAEKDLQITHLKEEQEIQLRAVIPTPTAAAGTSEKELAEKVNKLKQLLALAHNHINEHKRKLSDKQNDMFEFQKQEVRLKEEIEKLKSDKTKFSEKEFAQLQKNYEQNYRTSKHRIESLESQLKSTTKDLTILRNEFQAYKVRAAATLKTATPAPVNAVVELFTPSSSKSQTFAHANDQENLIRSLAQEIDSLKAGHVEFEETKMHVYKLEVENVQLNKQVKLLTDQANEQEARFKADLQKLRDEKQEASIRLNAQKDDIQQQLNLLQHNHKSILQEKEERVLFMEQQVKLLQEDTNMKAATIYKQQVQLSRQNSPEQTPRSAFSPRLNDLKNYYSEDPIDETKPTENNVLSLNRSTSNSSFGSHDSPRAIVDSGGDQILFYAQMQALREEELNKSQLKLKEMHQLLGEAERMEKLHHMQEQVLKQEIRDLQRAQKRESTNPEYLKNIIVKYIEFEDQQEKLLPVISTLLQLTPVEVKRLEEKQRKARSGLLSKVWG